MFQKCASSNAGIFAFFAFVTLNLNVMVDFMFSVMVTIMIMGNFGSKLIQLIMPFDLANIFVTVLQLEPITITTIITITITTTT